MPQSPDSLVGFRERLLARLETLPQGLQSHIHRVRDVAQGLAAQHGIDPYRAELASLSHDVARAEPGHRLVRSAETLGIPIGDVERGLPILLHGPVGAEYLRRDDGLADREILEAVRWHSTGHPGLGPLGLLVFIADKLDPQKAPMYPYQPMLADLAKEDLRLAVLEFLSRETVNHIQKREPVHPDSIEAMNALLAQVSGPTVHPQSPGAQP